MTTPEQTAAEYAAAWKEAFANAGGHTHHGDHREMTPQEHVGNLVGQYEAKLAAMREVTQGVLDHLEDLGLLRTYRDRLAAALSSDAGAALLKELAELREDRNEYRRLWNRIVSGLECPACESKLGFSLCHGDEWWNCDNCKHRWLVHPVIELATLQAQLTASEAERDTARKHCCEEAEWRTQVEDKADELRKRVAELEAANQRLRAVLESVPIVNCDKPAYFGRWNKWLDERRAALSREQA